MVVVRWLRSKPRWPAAERAWPSRWRRSPLGEGASALQGEATSNPANCVTCSGLKLSSLHITSVRAPLGWGGPQAMASKLSTCGKPLCFKSSSSRLGAGRYRPGRSVSVPRVLLAASRSASYRRAYTPVASDQARSSTHMRCSPCSRMAERPLSAGPCGMAGPKGSGSGR